MFDLMPKQIPNWCDGEQRPAADQGWLDKINPATGEVLSRVARCRSTDIEQAVGAARRAQPAWGEMAAVQRGLLLHKIVERMQRDADRLARIVALETGKSHKDALGETQGAIALGLFYASEGQRLYGRTTTSAMSDRTSLMVRQPVGVAGLIIAANTPIANVAWKVFPALVCGNGVVLKAAEDTPGTAWCFGQLAHEAGLPAGVLNIVQGLGEEAGAPLVAHPDVDLISFTGSSAVGKKIAAVAGARLCKVSLELGGKNPLVVCDDADLENAVKWSALSAFSNAGQRCAAAGRIVVFKGIYDRFREALLARTRELKAGPGDDDDLGPVINQKQLTNMLDVLGHAEKKGAKILVGGSRLTDPGHKDGFYMAPTVVEGAAPDDEISTRELFGPIVCLYKAKGFAEALALANRSPYGLTACIHTTNLHRAWEFSRRVQAGVAVVNAGTYGSEPHMPFGGVKNTGNGHREAGETALDIL